MNKKIRNNDVYYQIAWSKIYKYDKYDVIKIVPELAGIICLGPKSQSNFNYSIFYACWRDGCRVSIKKLVDPRITLTPELTSPIKGLGLRAFSLLLLEVLSAKSTVNEWLVSVVL